MVIVQRIKQTIAIAVHMTRVEDNQFIFACSIELFVVSKEIICSQMREHFPQTIHEQIGRASCRERV